jgi:hypothetical protein
MNVFVNIIFNLFYLTKEKIIRESTYKKSKSLFHGRKKSDKKKTM